MIQFNIQFKTKFEIFVQQNIHSKMCPKYSIHVGPKWGLILIKGLYLSHFAIIMCKVSHFT